LTIASAASMAATSPFVSIIPSAICCMTLVPPPLPRRRGAGVQ
jgi:hypothetical protein